MKILNTIALIGQYVLILIYAGVILNQELNGITFGYLLGELLPISLTVITIVYLHKTRKLVK